MLNDKDNSKTYDELVKENVEIQSRLDEAEETLNAIQNAEIDAIINTNGSGEPRVYTLEIADYLYRILVQEMSEGVATLTYDGTIFYSNAQFAAIIQVPLDKISGQKIIDFILPDDLETYTTIFEEGLKTGTGKGEISIKPVDGVIILVHISINTLKGLKGVYVVITDLTEQKYHEEQIQKSLKEKELLLSEIHHRVKNNLQIIASLLNLQARNLEGDVADILKTTETRVKSIAIVHERLYQSPSFNDINVKGYLKKLIDDIINTYGVAWTIKTNLNIDDINLNIDTIIPLGLIINELITNCVKYAFPQKEGIINIKLKSLPEQLELTIADDGIGIPEDFDIENIKTLGLQLVTNLTDQIDGQIEIDRSHGTEFKITFNELKYKERL
jgi:PAS domain S-box-containing protein